VSATLHFSCLRLSLQVSATLPFNCLAAAIFSCIVYGMAGLRPGAGHVLQACTGSMMLSLIATQVRPPTGGRA
jgi:hypothetical protein